MSKTSSHTDIQPLRKRAPSHFVQGGLSAGHATGRDIIHYLGERDPTSLRMMQAVLAIEEEQGDYLDDLRMAFVEKGGRHSGTAS